MQAFPPVFFLQMREDRHPPPVSLMRIIRLTLLAPEIVHAILAGTLQRSVPLEKLRKELPVRWEDQKKLFGVE